MGMIFGYIAVLALWLVGWPHVINQLLPNVGDSLAVKLWWVWLLLFAMVGYHINNITDVKWRVRLGVPVVAPFLSLFPITLYHWAGLIIARL